MKMLTSSNQYLRPEYLTPLATTLDAKKSPLALLAQTCSQIGADSQNPKLIQNGDKNSKTKTDSGKEKNIKPGSPNKANFKPYESSLMREKSNTPEERSNTSSSGSRTRTPITSKSSATNGRCNSNQSASSPRGSPAIGDRKTPQATDMSNEEQSPPSKFSERTNSPQIPVSSSLKQNMNTNVLTSSTDHTVKDMPLGTFKPGVIPVSSAYPTGYHSGMPLGMDLMTSSLMSQHHHAMKTGALSPFLNYARMKVPADHLGPMCRDPYCTGCGLSSHLLGQQQQSPQVKTPTSCAAGCTQCDHAVATSKAQSYLGHNQAAAAYAHAQLAALAAASHLPYVCNWISGDAAYCGKLYSSSEELLAHLRTHTSVGSVSDATSALSMLSAPGLPPTHSLLHRAYPTPPLSPLASARYHPYSKPSLLPPSLTSSLSGYPLSHPGIPPYLSHYSLYGPRLGSGPSMHP